MINTTPHHPQIDNYRKDYCSQKREPLPQPRSVEEGVALIEKTLKKEILCRHDVEEINQLYQAVDLLERKVDKIPELNSHYVLKKIVEKVQKIVNQRGITPRNLIFLYHLQQFSELP